MLSEELSHLIFLLAINTNVNHNGKTIEFSSILSNSGGVLFYFFWLNGQVEKENKRLLQNIVNSSVYVLECFSLLASPNSFPF